MKRQVLGDLLKKENILTNESIEIILKEQKISKEKFGKIAQKLGFANEIQISKALASQANMSYFNLEDSFIDNNFARKVSAKDAREYNFLPLYESEENTLVFGITYPTDIKAKDKIKQLFSSSSKKIVFVIVDLSELYLVQARIYSELNFRLQIEYLAKKISENINDQNIEKSDVPQIVNYIIWDALSLKASDIHLVYNEDIFRVFYRINGQIKYVYALDKNIYSKISTQIKYTAGMELGEKLKQGDGQFKFNTEKRNVSIRVSKLPTIPLQTGESLVLRLLDQNKINLNIEKLGFFEEDYIKLKKICENANGMILCTGPTGSGKSTTLYSLLTSLNVFSVNILTVENPVEYQIAGVRQVQVNEKSGLTFANTLKTFLRHDPDVILVGEIRDKETAEIAIQSSLTGHLVLSTLHTNDAVSAVPRLFDFGINKTSLQSSVKCIIAQRLVKKLCSCKIKREIKKSEVEFFKKNDVEAPVYLYEPNNLKENKCKLCVNGFLSSTIIYEIIFIDNDIVKEFISPDIKYTELKKNIVQNRGVDNITQNGLKKVAQGLTSFEEILRVVV
ncbi:MAG: GspE/PulE family protein [Minisyncoccales bacterium]